MKEKSCGKNKKRYRALAEKLHEVDLAQFEDRFYRVFNNSPLMMVISSMDNGRFVEVNQAYTEKIGYSRQELIGHTVEKFGIWINQEMVAKLRERGSKVDNIEAQIRCRSGKVLTVLASLDIMEFNQQPCRLTVLQNITEMRMLESALARMDRLNLIGEMAASIGHEIRNPLTAVRGFLQMLGAKYEYADEHAYFDLMIEELDKANEIISEFLGMAKDKGIDPRPQYLHDVINSLYPLVQADASKREMHIKLELNYSPRISIDENEIRQLIYKLARNGLEAMLPGGTLTIGTAMADHEIVLYIRDQGQGIPPQLIEKLGTPFLTTKDSSPGLGLAVCYSIAARHHARIDFESSSEGTAFYIYFPTTLQESTLF